MWSVMENGELVPLSVLNERAARAKCDELLRRHDFTTHGGVEYPFCEDYGCSSILEIQDALYSNRVKPIE